MWVYQCKVAGRKFDFVKRSSYKLTVCVWVCACVCACVCICVCKCEHTCKPFLLFPIFRKSAGASHCSGPQRMSSYCGFGAPEQLDEFMVSAKKRRSLSFCQSWFPPRFKCRPLGCQGWTSPQPPFWGKWNVFEPCSDSVFTSSNYILLLSD